MHTGCTASATTDRPAEPVFQPGKTVPQLMRAPLVSFSTADCARVEAGCDDGAVKNALCMPMPYPGDLAGHVQSPLVSLANRGAGANTRHCASSGWPPSATPNG